MRILRFVWALIKYIIIGERVTKEEYEARVTLCYSCEYLEGNQCSICGCYVKKKAKWSTESCPKNKW